MSILHMLKLHFGRNHWRKHENSEIASNFYPKFPTGNVWSALLGLYQIHSLTEGATVSLHYLDRFCSSRIEKFFFLRYVTYLFFAHLLTYLGYVDKYLIWHKIHSYLEITMLALLWNLPKIALALNAYAFTIFSFFS